MKYMLISYLILAVVMIYFANKVLEVKKNLDQKVAGVTTQINEINKIEAEMYGTEMNQETRDVENYMEAMKAFQELQ